MRVWFAAAMLAALSACATVETNNSPPEVIAAAKYREPGPASLTLMTMVNNRTGGGGHTALMINGSQRVIFDPAGSFVNDRVPERDDVLYGVSPPVLAGYKSAHARSTFHVVSQTVQVTPAQAETALRLAQQNGPVPRLFCTSATTELLRQVPGFQDIQQTMFPTNLMEQMERRVGVKTDRYYEDDDGTIIDGVARVQL
ncbi:MAG: hypothetical protein AAGG57_16525 [Pseudomonadota bacterium]